MDLRKKVKSYIESNRLISSGDTVILGLSGGADSVCLFLILNSLRQEMAYELKAIHVHHGIRGEQADADAQFVKELCTNYDTELTIIQRNIPEIVRSTGESEEECGRRIRYEVFREEAKKYKYSKIAVAHHKDDQAETVIFRMVRGTGIKGIAGMKPVNGDVIRPLLGVSRQEIEDYLAKAGQDYCTDSTNADIDYSRNYIRNEILPGLERINSSAKNHICALAEDAIEIWNYVEEEGQALISKAEIINDDYFKVGNKRYSSKVILNSKPIIRNCAIKLIISETGASLKDITRDHIESIVDIMGSSKYSEVILPRGIKVVSESGTIYISDSNLGNNDRYMCSIIGDGEYTLPDGNAVVCRILNDFDTADIPQSRYTKWFDYDKISNGPCIRNKGEGDYLIVNDRGGTKKLKDYLINEKIPKTERDNLYLIANDQRIAWVIGYRISEDVKVSDTTKRVLEVHFIKGEEYNG